MSSWRDTILNEFVPNVSKLTLVSDPDSLLTEEQLALELRMRGFDLIEFNDPIEFRFAYESKYRAIWDQGEHTDLVVVLRVQDKELETLPYDLLQAGRKLSFSLGALFPNLSYPVLEQLEHEHFDVLYDAQRISSPGRMGDNATKDFILRHVFGIAAEIIKTEIELLRFLLRLHYGNTVIPPILSSRLVELLETNKYFQTWGLSQLITDAKYFFTFLQERWPIFLENLNQPNQIKDDPKVYGLTVQGPVALPFDHEDIRVYIDNLFIEGKLSAVSKPDVAIEKNSWILSGIITDKSDDADHRINRLFELIVEFEISSESRNSDWIELAFKWAELSALVHTSNHTSHKKQYDAIAKQMNGNFTAWLKTHYASLMNLPPTKPAMVHHIPRMLARKLEDQSAQKIALLVVDGLSLDQWITVRNTLKKQDPNLVFRESATFAWIPTLTTVSRQSIFAGKIPFYFPSTINSTNQEEKLWKQFWQDHGLSKLDIVYKRSLGDGDPVVAVDELINPNKTKVAGLVIDKVDKIIHGMQLGAAGMHNQISQWCEGEYLLSLIRYLFEHGFDLWVTSDHGNKESNGIGRPNEGSIAESRGERVRVYPTPELRSQIATDYPTATEWNQAGLPPNYYPLVCSGNDAFIREDESIVGHGGISIEEVMVPLINIERRTTT